MKGARKSSASALKPAHWPTDVQYISRQRHHSSVSKDILSYLHPRANLPSTAQVASTASTSRPSVVIRDIAEEGHPAKGQRGLFITRKIPPRTHIIGYVGGVRCGGGPGSGYGLSLYRTAEVNVGVDASKAGNEARFINDYRGVKSKPNAVFEERRTDSGELCMSIRSGSEEIKKGEEILVSYGKGFWTARSSESTKVPRT